MKKSELKNIISKEEYSKFSKNQRIMKNIENTFLMKNLLLISGKNQYIIYDNVGSIVYEEVINYRDPEFRDRIQRNVTPIEYKKAFDENKIILNKAKEKINNTFTR